MSSLLCMCCRLSVFKCFILCIFFFFKQKTAYEMRISDWSSDVCSSDLHRMAASCCRQRHPQTRPPPRNPPKEREEDAIRDTHRLLPLPLATEQEWHRNERLRRCPLAHGRETTLNWPEIGRAHV